MITLLCICFFFLSLYSSILIDSQLTENTPNTSYNSLNEALLALNDEKIDFLVRNNLTIKEGIVITSRNINLRFIFLKRIYFLTTIFLIFFAFFLYGLLDY